MTTIMPDDQRSALLSAGFNPALPSRVRLPALTALSDSATLTEEELSEVIRKVRTLAPEDIQMLGATPAAQEKALGILGRLIKNGLRTTTTGQPEKERALAFNIASDPVMPAEARLPVLSLLCDQKSEPFNNVELTQIINEVDSRAPEVLSAWRGARRAEQKVFQILVKLVATCATPALQKAAINALRGLLADPQGLSVISPIIGSNLSNDYPVARRMKELVENPSALAADRIRDKLILGRQRQILTVMRETPLLREAIAEEAARSQVLRDLLSRRREFSLDPQGMYKSGELGFEATRKFTPIFAALCATESGRDLLRVAIDARNRETRDNLWRAISRDRNYHVPEVVVGSGPSAANYRSTMLTLSPDKAPLVIDAQGFGGGQFAAVVDGVFRLNSRARPFGSISRQNLPGTESPLNTLGPYCPVQESDLTSSVYGDQTNLGLAIEINNLLAGGVACNVALVGWNSFEAPDGTHRIVLALRRTDTGETATMTTDRLVFARGLGSPRCAFRGPVGTNPSPQSPSKGSATRNGEIENILKEEAETASSGGFARYRSFPQFLCDMANRSNPFPLQGVKRVAVIGAGDSGNVTVEALLGYGPEIGQAPQELDRVLSVDWYGQEAKTKEQFETCRNRYAQLANDFPRKSNPSADYRISPIPVKAVGLSRAEDGRLRVKDLMGTKRDYDLVIDCSGFDRTPVAQYFDPKLVVQVNEETTRATKGKSKRSAGARSESPPLDYFGADQVTAAIKLLESQLLKASYIPLEVLGYSQRVTDIARVTPDQLATVRGGNWLIELGGGTFVLASRGALKTWAGTSLIQSKFDDSQTILENLKRLLGRPSLFDSPDAEPNLLLFVADRNVLSTVQTAAEEAKSDGNPSGPLSPVFGTINGEKVEIAQKVSGQEVYVIGPETNLTFTGKERNKIQANFIAEIIGAVFLFSGRITTLAEILAERGRIGEADADGRSESRDRPAKVELKWGERMYNTEARLFLEPSPVVGRLLGPTIDPQTVVEAFVRYAYRDHRPDYTQSALTFSARLDNRSKKPPILNFQTSHALPIPIHEDPVFVRACHILLTRPPYRPNGEVNEFTITVPTRGRYDAQAEFAWSNAVYTAKPASTPRFGANRSTLTTAEVQQKIRESGKSRKAPER